MSVGLWIRQARSQCCNIDVTIASPIAVISHTNKEQNEEIIREILTIGVCIATYYQILIIGVHCSYGAVCTIRGNQ